MLCILYLVHALVFIEFYVPCLIWHFVYLYLYPKIHILVLRNKHGVVTFENNFLYITVRTICCKTQGCSIIRQFKSGKEKNRIYVSLVNERRAIAHAHAQVNGIARATGAKVKIKTLKITKFLPCIVLPFDNLTEYAASWSEINKNLSSFWSQWV